MLLEHLPWQVADSKYIEGNFYWTTPLATCVRRNQFECNANKDVQGRWYASYPSGAKNVDWQKQEE